MRSQGYCHRRSPQALSSDPKGSALPIASVSGRVGSQGHGTDQPHPPGLLATGRSQKDVWSRAKPAGVGAEWGGE